MSEKKQYLPLKAEGPKCLSCNHECTEQIETRNSRIRTVWRCTDKPMEHGRMTYAQGLERWQKAKTRAHQEEVDANRDVSLAMDMDDMGHIADILDDFGL